MPPLAHPRHWPTWLGLGILYVLGRLPLPLLWALGQLLGWLAGSLARTRRRVAARNLALCLPAASPAERARILRAHFGWLGVAALTQGVSWGISRRRLVRLVRLRHRERIDAALAAGRPVIVLAPHFVGMELGEAAFTALVHPGVYMYQRIRNPVVDWQLRRARQQHGTLAIERRDDLRGLIRALKQGRPFIYLPDQDGGRRGLFVPFCGVPASTAPMLGRFAALTDALVIPTAVRFLPWGRGLEIRFAPPLADFPSGDPVQDATRMNQVIETRLRLLPEQYFWVHRRFKTRPPGAVPIYGEERVRRG